MHGTMSLKKNRMLHNIKIDVDKKNDVTQIHLTSDWAKQ